MINLAFLGCGMATRMHSKTLKRFAGYVRLFYASRRREPASEYNARFGGAGAFASYEAALADPAIHAVLIATPPVHHLDLAVRALRSGKHVIVEKPPFLRAADFDVVRAVQAESGLSVFVAENYFYKPLTRALRRLVTDGAIGEIRFVDVKALKTQRTADWRDDLTLAGGGALFEGGIHWINFMGSIGLTIRSAMGVRPGDESGRDRTMLVIARYEEGAVGTLFFSWETPSALNGVRLSRIYGSAGSITFESNGLFIVMLGARKRVILPGFTDLLGYRAMFRDILDCIESGRKPQLSLDSARRDVELLEEIYRTAGSGQWEEHKHALRGGSPVTYS